MTQKEKLLSEIRAIEQNEKQAVATLKELQDKLQNKSFRSIVKKPFQKGDYREEGIYYVLYTEFKLSEKFELSYKAKNVWFWFTPKLKNYHTNAISAKITEEVIFDGDICPLLRGAETEIPTDEFQKIWNYANERIKTTIDLIATELPADYLYHQHENNEELDLDYIIFPDRIKRYVENSLFYMNNGRFLKTPNSKKYLIKQINEAERWASLPYESCDIAYINNLREQIKELRKMLW